MAQTRPGPVAIEGNVDRRAIPANDRGRVDASLQLAHVTIALKPSADRQADLERFLVELQDPSSPNYHGFLTPEQYGARFGAPQSAIDRIAAWLTSSNLRVLSVARGRNAIAFSGNVRQVESAFGTEIHTFSVNGESHYANTSAPQAPAELSGSILAIRGLDSFKMKSRVSSHRVLPNYTAQTTTGVTYLGPADIDSLYDIKPLHNAGITGSGQRIAIVGDSDIYMSDIVAFRSFFSLPPTEPTVVLVPNTLDPGISSDLVEADLDIEFAGAAAPDAAVIYIYSTDVGDAVQYAIDENFAPVVSMSFGSCEADSTANLMAMQALAQQANVQGITWIAASGDNGAADCYADPDAPAAAQSALAVDEPGSIPEVTSVGGTELNEANGNYFAPINDLNQASVFTYVPEMAWNDSAIAGTPLATGGGVSSRFAKPSWQTGTGVPTDGFRDVPDISLAASPRHDGRMFYNAGTLGIVGGTSVAAPTFAGIVALLNQYLISNGFQTKPGVGNVNPRLYAMAQSVPSAFHDITTGNNIVNACSNPRGCTVGSVGYSAGPGYDPVTGWGSLDVFNLITGWSQTSTAAKGVAALTLTQLAVPGSLSSAFAATVTASDGGTPTGAVTLIAGGATVATATLASAGSGKSTATLTVVTSKLPAGLSSVSAEYSGDASYGTAAASLDVTVASSTVMFIQGVTNAASYKQAFSSGEIVAVFGNLLAGSTQSAATVPLPTTLGGVSVTVNGVPAPLYFISPGQINLQIPYGLPTSSGAVLTVTYNGQIASATFPASAASPGIFVDSTGAPAGAQTAARGQTIAIYVTGTGGLSPQPDAGSLPDSGTTPVPTSNVVVSVAGINVNAAQPYVYEGVPAWAIGLIQINFTVPANTPLGPQPVVVAVGSSFSATATVLITK